jgi:acyl-CoA synthetase (AMP-forming)/AMP-acid ligase II
MVDHWVGKYPGSEALRVAEEQIRWTYKDLKRHSSAIATGLIDHQMHPGERVLLWLPNDAEHVTFPLAAAMAGVVVSFAPQDATIEQLRKLIHLVQPRMLLFNPSMRPDAVDIMHELVPECLSWQNERQGIGWKSEEFPSLKWIWHNDPNEQYTGMIRLRDGLAYAPIHPRIKQAAAGFTADSPFCIEADATATKATVFSHAAAVKAAEYAAQSADLKEGDAVCIPHNAASVPGMTTGYLAALSQGIPVVLPSKTFDSETAKRVIAEENCTVFHVSKNGVKDVPAALRTIDAEAIFQKAAPK